MFHQINSIRNPPSKKYKGLKVWNGPTSNGLIMVGGGFGSVRLYPLVSSYALWVFVRIFIQILVSLLVLLNLTYTMAAFTKRYKRLAPQMRMAFKKRIKQT